MGKRPFLYVNVGHIMRLTGFKETYCYKELAEMKIKYHVKKPHRVTVDMVCDFHNITPEQFYSLFKDPRDPENNV